MPKPPEEFAKDLMAIAATHHTEEATRRMVKAVQERDFALMTSTNDRLGGTD